MKRNINIIAKNYITKIPDFDPLSIENTDNLVNCSVDNIVFGCIELIDKNTARKLFETLCEKLRPKGVLIIKFHDLKSVCQSYLNNSMSNTDLLQITKNLENPVNIDEIITYVNINSFKVINILKEDKYITMYIMRTSL